MITRLETPDDLAALKTLLIAVDLPVSDIAMPSSQIFFGIRDEATLLATVGVECHGENALLRSLAVVPAHRNHGLARTLVHFAEEYAVRRGVSALYLLTTTAEAFFSRLGYARVARENAPPSVAASAQFSGICPAAAAFLGKSAVHTAD